MIRFCPARGITRRGIPRILLILMIFLIGVFITCSTTAEGTTEKPKTESEKIPNGGPKEEMHGEDGFQLEESYRRFRSQFGDSYEAEILYSGFGPHRGTWRITVQEGELRRWVFRNKENLPEHRDFAENLTMEVLYKRAEENDTLELSYDESGMISEIVSPAQGEGPTDRGYLIRIVSIEKTKQ